MKAIRSRKYLAGSRGATCKLRIAGVTCSGVDTVVPCHVRDRHTGRSIKASDISVADGCLNCHDVFDRRSKLPSGEYLSDEDWLFYALRGLQETLEAREAAGLLVVPRDIETPSHAKPTRKRKPPEQRAKVQPRENAWPPKGSRKIPTRHRTDA